MIDRPAENDGSDMVVIPAGNIEFAVDIRQAGKNSGPALRICKLGEEEQLVRFDLFDNTKEDEARSHYHYGAQTDADIGERHFTDPVMTPYPTRWMFTMLKSRVREMVAHVDPITAHSIDFLKVMLAIQEAEKWIYKQVPSA
tara:strand:- start:144 stop:569 length:426 start_codon:yes stop_codon:yes gene_type:complete